jgi:hypothetical protein
MRQLASGEDGRTFLRLVEHEDYAAHFDAGYESGRQDGLDVTLKRRMDEYLEVLKACTNALLALADRRELRRALVVATIEELLLRPVTGGPPVASLPRYHELLGALRASPAKQAGGSPGGAAPPPDPDEPAEEAAEMLEAAAYADSMARLCARLAEPSWLGPIDSLVTLVEMTVADWIAEFTAEASTIATRALRFNCRPFDQGYVVGAWLGASTANTFVDLLELAVTFPPPTSLAEVALIALASGIVAELEDDDVEPD